MSTYTTPSGVVLDLRLAAGLIEVSTSDGDTTTVSLEPLSNDDQSRELIAATREEARSEADGSTRIIVHVPEKTGLRRFLGTPEVLIRVQAPTAARLNATTASADVRCSGRLGGAAIKTASGDITLPDVDGRVEIRTASGDVRLGNASGQLRVQSMSGDVSAGDVGGDLFAKSMSGDVMLGVAAGSVEASSMSGDIRVAEVQAGSVSLSSMSGDVDVAVKRGTRVYLDVSTLSGEARSELPMSDQPSAEGGAELTLRANTKSGDVRIRRAAEPAATSS
jgi:Putative adhesin